MTTYNKARIAWELERTAMGDGYYGNALRVAKDMPDATAEDRALLDRWATGRQCGTDGHALQRLALRLYETATEAKPATESHDFREWDEGYIRTRLSTHSDGRRVLEYTDRRARVLEYTDRRPRYRTGSTTIDANDPMDLEIAHEMLGGIDRDLDAYLNALA